MDKLAGWLLRISTGRNMVVSLVLFAGFAALMLPVMQSRAASQSKLPSLDIHFGYTAQDAYALAASMTESARTQMALDHFTYDLAFPFVYVFALVTLVGYTYRRAAVPESRLRALVLLALTPGIADLLENAGIAAVLLTYPPERLLLGSLAAAFSLLKWALVLVALLVALRGLFLAFLRPTPRVE